MTLIQPLDVFVVTVDLVSAELKSVQHSLIHQQFVELHPEQGLLCGAALGLDSRVRLGKLDGVVTTHHPHVIHKLNNSLTPRIELGKITAG